MAIAMLMACSLVACGSKDKSKAKETTVKSSKPTLTASVKTKPTETKKAKTTETVKETKPTATKKAKPSVTKSKVVSKVTPPKTYAKQPVRQPVTQPRKQNTITFVKPVSRPAPVLEPHVELTPTPVFDTTPDTTPDVTPDTTPDTKPEPAKPETKRVWVDPVYTVEDVYEEQPVYEMKKTLISPERVEREEIWEIHGYWFNGTSKKKVYNDKEKYEEGNRIMDIIMSGNLPEGWEPSASSQEIDEYHYGPLENPERYQWKTDKSKTRVIPAEYKTEKVQTGTKRVKVGQRKVIKVPGHWENR